jgi:ribosomal protein L11 methyltransferase
MSNIYIGYHFTISPLELGSEILIAELGETPFRKFY